MSIERPRPVLATLIIVILLAALPRISASIYTPSMPSLAAHFATDMMAVKLTFTTYIMGLGIGQLLYGPLSDRYGRRPILILGLGLFILASLGCAVAPSIGGLALGRFFQACSAAAGGVLARAIVRDLFGPDRSAQAFAYVAMATTLSPALGPLIGGQIQDLAGWQATFFILAAVGAALLIFVFFRLPETRRITSLTPTNSADIARAFATLFRSPTFMGYSLNSAFLLSALLCFYGTAPFLLIDSLGISPLEYGYYSGAGVVGYLIGNFIVTRLPGQHQIERFVRIGTVVAALGSLAMLGLAWLQPISLMGIILPFALMSAGAGMALPSGFAGSTNRYPQIAGTSSALAGFLNMLASTIATILIARYATDTALPLAAFMLGLTTLALFSGAILRSRELQEAE